MIKMIANMILILSGWKVDKLVPEERKFILIAAPHTSNWDFVYTILFIKALGVNFNWVAKHTMFKWPFGMILRSLGGIAVDRRTKGNNISKMASVFKYRDDVVIAIAPEGTRRKVDGWKTGFYYIAMEAKVPIALGYFDYAKKEMGIGKIVYPCGDICADMEIFKSFYMDKVGCCPDKSSEIKVHDCD